MPNDDLELSASFNIEDYLASADKFEESQEEIATQAEETAKRVDQAANGIIKSWEGQGAAQEESAKKTQSKTSALIDKYILDSKRGTASYKAENEDRTASDIKRNSERDRLDREYRQLQAAHAAALKEDAARTKEGDFFENGGGRQVKRAIRTTSILSGIRDSRSIDAFLGGIGGPAGIAAMGGLLAAGAARSIVSNAGKQAEDLKKISDAMGITVAQAGKLSFAANLANENMDSMTSASRKLAEALQEPGTTGKKTADALIELGVSLREGMGAAFQDAAQKLIALKDPTEQAALGAKIFGQNWRGVLEMFRELPNVTQNIDTGLNEKLRQANQNLKDFGNTWTIVRGESAGAIISMVEGISKVGDAEKNAFTGKGTNRAASGGRRPTQESLLLSSGVHPNYQIPIPTYDSAGVDRLLNGASKIDLEQNLLTAKNNYANHFKQMQSDRKIGAGFRYSSDAASVRKDTEDVNKWTAAIKAADKAAANAQSLPELLARWHDRAAGLGQPSAVAKLDEEYKKDTRQYGLKPFSSGWSDMTASYGLLRADAVKKQQDQLAKQALDLSEAKDRMDRAMNAGSSKSQFDLGKATSDPKSPFFNAMFPTPELQAPSMLSARNQGSINRAVAHGTTELNQAFNPFSDSSQVAKQNLELKLQEVEATRQLAIEEAKALEPAKEQAEVEKANTEATVQRYQTIIEYEKQIAEVRKQQLQETKSFATGFFNAAISGQPSAGSNFLRSWGRGMADKIVGNAAAGTIGTMESHLTLQRDPNTAGMLGTAKNPNFLGKLLQGTPFGLDPASAKLDPKALIQKDNTTAVEHLTTEMQALTAAIAKAAGIDPSSLPGGGKGAAPSSIPKPGGAANLVFSIAGKGAGIAKNIQSGDISGSVSQAAKFLGAFTTPKFTGESPVFGGSTGGGNNVDLSPIVGALAGAGGRGGAQAAAASSGAGLFSDPFTAFTRSMNRFGSAVGPGGTPTFLPSGITGSDGGGALPWTPPSIKWQIPNIPSASSELNTGGFTPSKGSYDPTAALAADPGGIGNILKSMGATGASQGSQDVSASVGIMGKLGNLLNGTKYVTSGQAPGAVLNGTVQNPDGTWSDVSTSQRWGAGLGLAASTIGGGMAAYGGFSKGGARGDIQGIAGTAAAIAPFTGPTAPFIEGGAALMGLVSSLFPDPRQQRIKQQQKTLLGNAYLQPASRDYDFSSGDNSEGFSYGMGGSIRAGGPTANTNITIQAMDASSFVSWGQNNPQAMAQAMLYGLNNGSSSAVMQELQFQAAHAGFFG